MPILLFQPLLWVEFRLSRARNKKMNPKLLTQVYERARCLYSESEVEAALDKLADAIEIRLKDSNPVMLCVMNGGLIVTGKLATRLDFPLQIDYLHATRYRDQTTGSDLQWKVTPSLSLQNRPCFNSG